MSRGGVEVAVQGGTIVGGTIWLPPGHWHSPMIRQLRALPGYVRAFGRRIEPASALPFAERLVGG